MVTILEFVVEMNFAGEIQDVVCPKHFDMKFCGYS